MLKYIVKTSWNSKKKKNKVQVENCYVTNLYFWKIHYVMFNNLSKLKQVFFIKGVLNTKYWETFL